MSWISYSKVSIPLLTTTGLLSLKTLLTSGFGFYNSKKFEQTLYLTQKFSQQRKETPTLPLRELQKQLLLFYATFIFFIVYLSAGVMGLVMKNQQIGYVKVYLFELEAFDEKD